MEVVERGCALRYKRAGRAAGNGAVARELVGGELAGLSQRPRNGIRAGGDPAMYAHRPSPGNQGVRQGVGGNDASPTSAAQRWSSCEAGDGSNTGAAGVRLLECNS